MSRILDRKGAEVSFEKNKGKYCQKSLFVFQVLQWRILLQKLFQPIMNSRPVTCTWHGCFTICFFFKLPSQYLDFLRNYLRNAHLLSNYVQCTIYLHAQVSIMRNSSKKIVYKYQVHLLVAHLSYIFLKYRCMWICKVIMAPSLELLSEIVYF